MNLRSVISAALTQPNARKFVLQSTRPLSKLNPLPVPVPVPVPLPLPVPVPALSRSALSEQLQCAAVSLSLNKKGTEKYALVDEQKNISGRERIVPADMSLLNYDGHGHGQGQGRGILVFLEFLSR